MQIETMFSGVHAYSGINVSYFLYIIFFFVSFFSGTIRPSLEELSRQYHSQKKKAPTSLL